MYMRARGRRLETGQHAQQRRLAAAGAAQQAEDLARVDVQRDVVDGDEVAEFLGDVLDANVGRRIGQRSSCLLGRPVWLMRVRFACSLAGLRLGSTCASAVAGTSRWLAGAPASASRSISGGG